MFHLVSNVARALGEATQVTVPYCDVARSYLVCSVASCLMRLFIGSADRSGLITRWQEELCCHFLLAYLVHHVLYLYLITLQS